MASAQPQTRDQRGSSSTTSGSISPSTDKRPSEVAEVSLPKTSIYLPGPLPEKQQQEHSQERRRLQTQATVEETRQLTAELQTKPEQGPQRNENNIQPSILSKISKWGGSIVVVLAFIFGIVMIAPIVGQYATGVWCAAKDYQEFCKGERSMNNSITDACALIIDQPLPPPPGLDQVFKGIRWRDSEIVNASMFVWNQIAEKDLNWYRSLFLFTFSMLAMVFKGNNVELVACSVAIGYLIEEAWYMLPLRSIFLSIYFIWEPSFIINLGYVFIFTDCLYLRQGGGKGLSWVRLKDLRFGDLGFLNMCRIGYTSSRSRGFQYTILFVYIFVVGGHCWHKLMAKDQFWTCR